MVDGQLTERRKLSPCRAHNGPRPNSEQKRYQDYALSDDLYERMELDETADVCAVSMQGIMPLRRMLP